MRTELGNLSNSYESSKRHMVDSIVACDDGSSNLAPELSDAGQRCVHIGHFVKMGKYTYNAHGDHVGHEHVLAIRNINRKIRLPQFAMDDHH